MREVERVLINRISSSIGGIWNPAQDVRIPIISTVDSDACWVAVGAKSWSLGVFSDVENVDIFLKSYKICNAINSKRVRLIQNPKCVKII